jgi:ABC-type Na+ transport system ATPase subunit NatA
MPESSGLPMIEASGLSKFYGDFAAIRDVSFSIPQGQVAAFLGPNGAGKSTTMKILTGYLAPSAGTARIAGLDVRNDRIAAAERLGYLPENGPLYPEMTPLALLRFFGRARGLDGEHLKQRIDAVVARCALEAVIEKPIQKLSKGYRQRVGMAQVLLHEPDVLIMDEIRPCRDGDLPLRRFRKWHQRSILLSRGAQFLAVPSDRHLVFSSPHVLRAHDGSGHKGQYPRRLPCFKYRHGHAR